MVHREFKDFQDHQECLVVQVPKAALDSLAQRVTKETLVLLEGQVSQGPQDYLV